MNVPPLRAAGWARWALRIAAALVAIAVALVVAVHTPPARQYALRRAIAAMEDRFRLHLRADALDYNLFALRATLSGVRVAARESPDAPFFTAERVAAELPSSAVLGPLAIERIDVDGGRVRVRRDAAGRWNLPEGTGNEAPGDPAALEIGVLSARRLDVEATDEASGMLLRLPALDLEIGGANRVELHEAGTIARADVRTTVSELLGGVAFDGRSIALTGLAITTDEIEATVNGTLTLLAVDPRMDLRVGGEADTAGLARWVPLDDPPAGAVVIDAAIAGPFSGATVAGTIRSAEIEWRGVSVNRVQASVVLDPALVRLDSFEAQLADGEVFVTGAFPLDARTAQMAATWHDLELAQLTAMLNAGGAVRPSGRVSGTIDASGPGVELDEWVIDATSRVAMTAVESVPLEIAGTAEIEVDRGSWTLALADAAVNRVPVAGAAQGRLRFDDMRRSTLAGRVTLPPAPVRDVLAAAEQAGLDVQPLRLDPAEPGTVQAAAILSGTFGRPQVRFEGEAAVANAASLAPGTPLAGRADVRFEGDLDEVRIDVALHAIPATARAAIAASAPYHVVVDVDVIGAPLDALLRGITTPVPLTGTLTAAAHAEGPLQRWRESAAAVEVLSLDARAGALPVSLAAPARLEYATGEVRVRSLELLAGGVRVSATGGLPVRATGTGSVLVSAAGDLTQFASAAAATGALDLADLSGTGPAALLARVSGSIEAPIVVADLELGPGTLRWSDRPPATNVQLRAHADGTWVDLHDLTGEWQGSRIQASGRAPIAILGDHDGAPSTADRPPTAQLTATVTSVTPAVLAPFVDPGALDQVEGSIDATLRLETPSLTLAEVTGELRLDRMDVRVADLPVVQRQPTRVELRGGFARVASWEWAGQGASVGVEGQVRLADRQTALLVGGRFDLRMLSPFTRAAGVSAAGSVEPRLSITGPIERPRIDGVAVISGGDLRLADPRVIATGLEGQVVLSLTRAQLTSLTGTINGGDLAVTGAVEYGADAATDASFRIEARGMAIEMPEGLRSELDADLAVALLVPESGAIQPGGTVTGTVTILRAAYREPMGVITGLLGTLRTERLAAQAASGEPSLANNVSLDVRVLTEDDVVVDNNVAQLQLGADLRLIGTAAAPSLAGRAELREGGRVFFGRNVYTIDAGTIDFVNPATIEPDLHLEARTRAGGVDIVLTLDGTPGALESSLAAPDASESYGQADLASLLLTGRTLEDVYGDEARVVGEQVLGYLSGDVLGLAGRAVGLDTLRLGGVEEGVLRRDFTDAATELDPTSRLTVGKALGHRFDVTFSQSLRDGDAQAWILDFRPWRRVEFRFVSNDDDLRSYGFRHDVSFGANAAALAAPSAAGARERRELVVGAVVFAGAPVLPEPRLRALISHDAGETFDFVEWQRDRDRLEAQYRSEGYCEARVSARRAEGRPPSDEVESVTLTYEIDAGPRCVLDVTGHDLDAGTRAQLMQAWTNAVFDRFLEEEARDIASGALAGQGYFAAEVQAVVEAAEGLKTLSVRIDPGPRGGAPIVRIDTADAALAADLTAWMHDAGLEQASALEPGLVEEAMTALLRSRGHLRAQVAVAPPSRDGADALVSIRVDPGPVFVVDDVRVEGAARLEAIMVRDAVGLAAGDTYDPAAVERARERLAARYRREGFLRAGVQVQQAVDAQRPAVDVTFDVTEGPRQVLAAIGVFGNRGIEEDVIVRAMALPVGEPVSADGWLRARTRLFDTGLFRRVDVEAVPMEEPGDDPLLQPMRARVTVQEWPLVRLRYGFQVEEQRPETEADGRDLVPGISADLTRRTLFGRAVSLGAAFDYERRERRGRGFINAPTMFGWPIESSLVGEWARAEFTSSTLVTDTSRISWEQRIRAVRSLRLSYAYRFERNHTFDTSPPVDPSAPSFGSIVLDVARLNVIGAWDTRDDPWNATRGMLLSSSLEYAPETLGSDIRFARFLGQAYYFRPWRGVVFASAARLGLAAGLEGQELIPSERFVTGGARSVRGAAEDSLAPRDIFDIPGGEALLVFNQEVRFPVYRWVRGVGFIDAGNVFEQISGLDVGGLVTSYGIGLRVDTPFALLRVDFGRLFSPGTASRSGRWSFGIGHAF